MLEKFVLNQPTPKLVWVVSYGINVAKSAASTSQSSTFGTNFANNAADRSISTYSLTEVETSPYWEITLDSTYYVNEIIISKMYCGGYPMLMQPMETAWQNYLAQK